jgi:hypothetical protein
MCYITLLYFNQATNLEKQNYTTQENFKGVGWIADQRVTLK